MWVGTALTLAAVCLPVSSVQAQYTGSLSGSGGFVAGGSSTGAHMGSITWGGKRYDAYTYGSISVSITANGGSTLDATVSGRLAIKENGVSWRTLSYTRTGQLRATSSGFSGTLYGEDGTTSRGSLAIEPSGSRYTVSSLAFQYTWRIENTVYGNSPTKTPTYNPLPFPLSGTLSYVPPTPTPTPTPSLPAITAPTGTITLLVGESLDIGVTATGNPGIYAASNLPTGLSINASTGRITGSPADPGEWNASLQATNSGGTGFATVTFVVNAPPPVIQSPTGIISGQLGNPMAVEIVATNSPTSYSASPLPDGLGINASTGRISGIPELAGAWTTTLTATHESGTGTATVTFEIDDPAERFTRIAEEIRESITELSRQHDAIQSIYDDLVDLTPDRIEVVQALDQTWEVRIAPKVPEQGRRIYSNAKLVYDYFSLHDGIQSKARNIAEWQYGDLGQSILEDAVMDEVHSHVISLANLTANGAERFLASVGYSNSRLTGLTSDEAMQIADQMRLQFWKLRGPNIEFLEGFNREVQKWEDTREAFLAALEAADDLSNQQKLEVRNRVLFPFPEKFPDLEVGPQPLPLSPAPRPINQPLGFNYKYVEPGQSLILPVSNDYSAANRPILKFVTPAADEPSFYRWVVYNFDGSLREVLHAGTPTDPGAPTLQLSNLASADSGTYMVMQRNAVGDLIETESFDVVVGDVGGAPPTISSKSSALDAVEGDSIVLAPLVASSTAFALDWYRDGNLIAENIGFMYFPDGVSVDDAGVYHAVAKNGGGTATGGEIRLAVTAKSSMSGHSVTSKRRLSIPRRSTKGRVTTSIRMSGAQAVRYSASVSVELRHTWHGDLKIFVIDPERRRHKLYRTRRNNSKRGKLFVHTYLPRDESFRPDGAGNGKWQLIIIDRRWGNLGRIKSWTVSVWTRPE